MLLELDKISKSYNKGKAYALDNFCMGFEPGIYGLLGPNGAGKSTLMNIIVDNLKPDAGTVTYDGTPIRELGQAYRAKIGYMPQQQTLYDRLTGEEFLWYMSSLKGLSKSKARERIDELLEVTSLTSHRAERMKTYSGGMKQRILIAQALLNDPEILVMDEPTAGLDPKERIRIRNFISSMAGDKIVLLATHIVSDIEFIASSILLMKDGKIIRQGTPPELLEQMEGKVYEADVGAEEYERCENRHRIANVSLSSRGRLLRLISDERLEVGEVREVRPTLEDLYLYYMG